jgi:hypothetical protein
MCSRLVYDTEVQQPKPLMLAGTRMCPTTLIAKRNFDVICETLGLNTLSILSYVAFKPLGKSRSASRILLGLLWLPRVSNWQETYWNL